MPVTSAPAPSLRARREGDLVVASDGVALPPYCVHCGADGVKRLRKTYYWHNPLLYLFILVGVLVYVVIGLLARKKATIELSLCDEHVRARRLAILGGFATAFVPFALCLAAMGMRVTSEVIALVGIVATLCLFGGLYFAERANRVLVVTKIDETGARLRGASPEFLTKLESDLAEVFR